MEVMLPHSWMHIVMEVKDDLFMDVSNDKVIDYQTKEVLEFVI